MTGTRDAPTNGTVAVELYVRSLSPTVVYERQSTVRDRLSDLAERLFGDAVEP